MKQQDPIHRDDTMNLPPLFESLPRPLQLLVSRFTVLTERSAQSLCLPVPVRIRRP